MATPSDLHAAVGQVIASGRFGVPLFVRYTATSGGMPEAARLACLTDVACGWVGQTLEEVYALGAADGSVTLAVQFREGATALISLVPHLPGGSGVDVMLLGNRGAIYHDSGDLDADAEDGAAAPQAVQAVIERALASGSPELVEAGAEP